MASGRTVDPILAALGIPDHQRAALQDHVLDPQPQGLRQAQPAPVEQARHQPVGALQERQHGPDLRPAQHHRQAPAAGAPG